MPFYGVAVLCADQPEIQTLLPRVEKRVLTYGLERPADLTKIGRRFGARRRSSSSTATNPSTTSTTRTAPEIRCSG